MKRLTKIYDLGRIPIIVRNKKDCKRAGNLVQRMAIKAIKEGNYTLQYEN